jgi:hypothetical protein
MNVRNFSCHSLHKKLIDNVCRCPVGEQWWCMAWTTYSFARAHPMPLFEAWIASNRSDIDWSRYWLEFDEILISSGSWLEVDRFFKYRTTLCPHINACRSNRGKIFVSQMCIPDVWILCKPNVFHPVVLPKDPVSWLLGTTIPRNKRWFCASKLLVLGQAGSAG